MAVIHVDGRRCEVKDDQSLLRACLSLGFDIPYFCWHPAMHSVGACRQCAVKLFKDESDTRGRIVMSCMTLAKDGMRVSIDDPEARAFRAGIAEFLMIPHPHDCPVCDEGGECHLQDMTVMTGHVRRRYRFLKRTHFNRDLGPFLAHEMNRCIACYRCVRFYCDYAGGRDFGVFQCANRVWFGPRRDGPLESVFSGNLAEVCPTGVFTDGVFAHRYSRKWDLRTAPSVCVHCSLGCATIPGERGGTLRRIRARYHGEVNGYFLCDRGRYGYDFVNAPGRIVRPLARGAGGGLEPCGGAEALERWARLARAPRRLVGIGSPRASLESNYALRALVGEERFFAGVPAREARLVAAALDALRGTPARSPSLHDISLADAVFVVGEGAAETAPMTVLSLRRALLRKEFALAKRLHIEPWDDAAFREAIQQECGPLYIASPLPGGLDGIATKAYRGTPEETARLAFAVARAIDGRAPAPPSLPPDAAALAEEIACALTGAERPLVLSGTGCGSEAVIRGAANVVRALSAARGGAELALVLPECDSMGLGLMGAGSLDDARRLLEDGGGGTVVVLENDLFLREGEAETERLLGAAEAVVAIDHSGSRTTARADLVLPAATFAEGSGTLVNCEGRAQRFFRVFPPPGEVRDSWRWIAAAMEAAGRGAGWADLDAVVAAMAAEMPALSPAAAAAPPASFRIAGQKIPRDAHRASGRTAVHAHESVHEPAPVADPDSALAFTMEGCQGPPPPALNPRFWSPGWNSVQAMTKFQQEAGGALAGGDPGVRLIEPPPAGTGAYFGDVPAAPERRPGEWLVVALRHALGGEELAGRSPAIASLTPRPFLALSPDDAAEIGARDGDAVRLDLGGGELRLPCRATEGIPRGTAGLAVRIPGAPVADLPRRSALRRGEEP